MQNTNLWKYCTAGQCREMLLSFRLLEGEEWSDDKVISCLYAVSNHVEEHYTRIRIPKRTGGFRELLAPDPLLKMIQRNILRHVLEGFTVSPRAMAYHKGVAICDNAAPHTGKKILLKMDIHDFFGSISFGMVHQSAFPGKYFPPSVGTMLTALCCCHEYLPQGSPAYRRSLKQEIHYCLKFGVREHLDRSGRRGEPETGEEGERRYLLSLLGKVSFVLSVNPEAPWFLNAGKMLEEAVKAL